MKNIKIHYSKRKILNKLDLSDDKNMFLKIGDEIKKEELINIKDKRKKIIDYIIFLKLLKMILKQL